LYFAERTSNKERTEKIFAPIPCKQVLPEASEQFWTDLEASTEIPSNELLCPDTENFTLQINYIKLVAYVTTCEDAIAVLGKGDAATDCEQDAEVVRQYLDKKVDIQTIWMAQNF
jgi:hypothetical protein